MRVPLGWLASFIDLPDEGQLCERLTLAGLEIEEIVRSGPDLSALRVGLVLEKRAHPNADRLSLCRVDIGGPEPVGVVCGAPNVAAGQKVAVALPGTILPDGTLLKKSKIRGETSEGMICSALELGLSDESSGILVLDPSAPVGAPLSDVVRVGETILDVEITPNRGDWVSMLGMAREVRALFGGELRMPPSDPAEGARSAREDVRVSIEAPDACARYVARVVRGVRIGPSPEWLRARLEAAGMRAINNVVDVTNLVLLELGQPLHAFDLAALRGGTVRVRRAAVGEKLAALDGETRALAATDLVIADAERAIALAGVIGGAETEVREATSDVLIESAQFAPVSVRRTSRRLGLRTEASYRFERGVDRDGVARAADRCARLIAEVAGGSVSSGRVEALGTPLPHADEVMLDPAHPNRLLGTKLSSDEVSALLGRVGVTAKVGPDGVLRCAIPSWRNDLAIAADLIEEVARIHGYDRIEPAMPVAALVPVSVPAAYELVDRARESLARAGLVELRLFPALVPRDLDALRLPPEDLLRRSVRIENPMPGQGSELATTLLPGLLHAAQRNLARQVERLRIFEAGRVFLARPTGELPEEPLRAAALVVTGSRASLWDAAQLPFFVAKGAAEAVLRELGQPTAFHSGGSVPWLHPGACGELRRADTVLCRLGELHPEVAKSFQIDAPCAVFELDLEACLRLALESPRYRDPSPFPAVRRDLSVLLDHYRPAGEVLEAIRKTAGSVLVSAEIFDRYEGKGVPPGKVSVAFRLVFQRGDRTLKDTEVGKTTERIVGMLGERFAAELR